MPARATTPTRVRLCLPTFWLHGTIFMQVTTPQQKIDKTCVFGQDAITITLTGDYFDQTLTAALRAECPVRLNRVNSFVDGAAVAQLGNLTYAALDLARPDQVMLAPENRICVTIRKPRAISDQF